MPAKSGLARGELTARSHVTIAKLAHADAMPEFKLAMKEATSPLAPAVKRAARDIPSTHSRYKAKERGGSLRSAVAGSIVRKFRFSTRNVSVVIAQVPRGGKSNLGSVVDGTKPWVHPTYGHKPEVTQPPHEFFYKTIEPMMPAVSRKIEMVLTKFEHKL